MQNRRYYRLVLTLISIPFAGPLAAAQPPPPSASDAAPTCAALKRDPLPVWRDSSANANRLNDCGFELRGEGQSARAEHVFAAALEMAKRSSDRSAEATALDGYGAPLLTPGKPDRAEPVL